MKRKPCCLQSGVCAMKSVRSRQPETEAARLAHSWQILLLFLLYLTWNEKGQKYNILECVCVLGIAPTKVQDTKLHVRLLLCRSSVCQH